MPMNEQKKKLCKAHIQWKGNEEQVDDILVLGFKLNLD